MKFLLLLALFFWASVFHRIRGVVAEVPFTVQIVDKYAFEHGFLCGGTVSYIAE